MTYTGGATLGAALGLPSLDAELAALAPEEIDKSTPKIFMRLDGIDGDADVKGHEGAIACYSCRWSLDGGRGNGRASDPHRGHVTVLKAIDKATPVLYEAGRGGGRLKTGKVTLERASGSGRTEPYCVVELTNVRVVGLETGQYGGESFERCVLEPEEGGLTVTYVGR